MKKSIIIILAITTLIVLSACTNSSAVQLPTATMDINAVQTAVGQIQTSMAQTVVADSTFTFASEHTALPSATSTPTPSLGQWKTYSDSEHGFSVDYPANFEVALIESNTSLYIGEQIQVWVSDFNPLDCRGDCPVVESTEPGTIAGLDAIKITGYIGSIGGNIPQKYIRYILQRDNLYYSFTLYALSFRAQVNDPTTIWPLKEDDIFLFERVLDTFKFTN